MALAPWEIDRQTGVKYNTSSTSKKSYSGPIATVRNSGETAQNRTFSRSSGGSYSGGGGGGGGGGGYRTSGTSTRGSLPSVKRPGDLRSGADKREVTKRTPGALPLTAEELAAFQGQRRAITKQAQAQIAQAERARKLALEQFVGSRFDLQSQAQSALRGVAGEGAGRGRGQARSGLMVGAQMKALQDQLTGGLGTLNRNLSAARGAADAATSQANIDRDAALARLEQQMALRKSLPSAFITLPSGG